MWRFTAKQLAFCRETQCKRPPFIAFKDVFDCPCNGRFAFEKPLLWHENANGYCTLTVGLVQSLVCQVFIFAHVFPQYFRQ